MKLTRRRALFYQRRTSNLYRLFALAVAILAGIWLVTRLDTGAVRNPLAPTPTPTRTINSYALEGQALFETGALDAAIQAYQNAAEVDPDSAAIWAELARIQAYSSRLLTNDSLRLQRLEEALDSATRAIGLAPEDSQVLAIHAFVLDWNADPALDSLRPEGETAANFLFQADQQALNALSRDPNNALALAFYAEILVDQQKWTQAEQYIQQALLRGPDLMDVRRVYAQYLESIGNYRQAIEEYQNTLALSPNLTFLYISIGVNFRTLALRSNITSQQTDLYNQALENFAKAATINEQLGISDPLPYVAIAKVYAQQGEFFAAALNAQKAIEFDPTNPDLYGQLGDMYYRGRNFETSIIALKCAVRGCTAEESCQARNGCPVGDPGVQITGLLLSDNSAPYYLQYGNALAIFGPLYREYCVEAVDVLSQLIDFAGEDDLVRRNTREALAICAQVLSEATQTPTPTATPTLTGTPTPSP